MIDGVGGWRAGFSLPRLCLMSSLHVQLCVQGPGSVVSPESRQVSGESGGHLVLLT